MGLQTHRDGGMNNAGCEDVNQLKMQIRKTDKKCRTKPGNPRIQ